MRTTPWILFLLAGACALAPDTRYPVASSPPPVPGETWVRVEDPRSVGVSPEGLDAALELAGDIGSHAVMVIVDGRLVAAWGDTAGRWYVASVRKSLLSSLYGEKLDGGALSLDTTLAELDIDDVDPSLTAGEKRATVRHLLTSSSGVYHRAAASDVEQLPARESTAPGEVFFYNNWDFNALGTIYRNTGADLFEDFARRVARPVGMEDFVPGRDGRLDFSADSVHPAYHFDMTARDLARFGVLMLRGGRWGDTQLIDPAWVQASTSAQVLAETEGRLGYGYMWWVVTEGSLLAELGIPPGSFFANGNLNQFVMVVPSRQLVVVHRGPNGDVSWDRKAGLVRAIIEAVDAPGP